MVRRTSIERTVVLNCCLPNSGVASDEPERGIRLRCRSVPATIGSVASARATRARTTAEGARPRSWRKR